jgi:hypothetical protein
VPILPLILNILDGLVAKKTVLYRGYAHIFCKKKRLDVTASRALAARAEALCAGWPVIPHSFKASQIHSFTEISENGPEVLCAVRVAKSCTVAQFHKET